MNETRKDETMDHYKTFNPRTLQYESSDYYFRVASCGCKLMIKGNEWVIEIPCRELRRKNYDFAHQLTAAQSLATNGPPVEERS